MVALEIMTLIIKIISGRHQAVQHNQMFYSEPVRHILCSMYLIPRLGSFNDFDLNYIYGLLHDYTEGTSWFVSRQL